MSGPYPAELQERGQAVAAGRARQRATDRRSLVRQGELAAPAGGSLGGDVLELWIGCEPVTYNVTARLIPHETLVGAHLVAYLVVIHHRGFHRRAVSVADHNDIAAGLHVTGAPVMRPLARRQRRRRFAHLVVKGHVHVAQLGALGVGIEVRGVATYPRPQYPGVRDVMGHPDQHLVGAVEHRLGGCHRSSALTCDPEEQEAESGEQAPSHTAPAFIKSCRCTIPTTFLSPSSTGSAMMPWRSMRLTAALANSSPVVAFGVRVMTSPTGMSRNLSVFSMSRVRSPAVTTPANAFPFAITTVPRFPASSTTHSRIGRSGVRSGRSWVSITSATRSSSLRPSTPPGCSAAKSSRRKPLTSSRVTARASPNASATVVLAVGASVSGQASSATEASRTTVACRPSSESASPVSARIGTPRRFS